VFNLQGSEIIVILLLALVVLGPEKLPDAIRRFGKAYAELKKMGTGFQQEFKSAMDEPMREMRESADMLRKSADFSAPPEIKPTEELPFGDPPAENENDQG
jgi:sec-independent protein translocase protein TatB